MNRPLLGYVALGVFALVAGYVAYVYTRSEYMEFTERQGPEAWRRNGGA